MFGDQLWPIMFALSFALNILLCILLLKRLHGDHAVFLKIVRQRDKSSSSVIPEVVADEKG